MVRPILWSGAKTVGRETLRSGGKILSDMADNSDGTPAGGIFSKHTWGRISKLKGRGHKRKARHVSSKKTGTKRAAAAAKTPRLANPKRTYKDIFA